MIPLTEETGIIEWVPHTHGLRHCCQDIYIADGTYDKRTVNMTVKKIYDGFQVTSHQAEPCPDQLSILQGSAC